MRALGRERRAAGVVVLEYREKGGLVADVGDALVVEEVKAADEGVRTTKEGDELGLVVRDETARRE